jgi:voltage-gated potassium channel
MKIKLNSYVPKLIAFSIILNGLVNLFTGIAPIFSAHYRDTFSTISKTWEILPQEQASSILSVFLGLTIIAIGSGLYHRRRTAWRWALVWVALTASNSLYPTIIPQTLVLSVIFAFTLLIYRKEFFHRGAEAMDYQHWVAWSSVAIALIYGIVGSYVLRDEFHGLHTLVDAVYYTLVTYSTLGYGDIVPVTTNAKIFTCSMIIIGVSSFVAALTVLVGPLIEKRMKGVFSFMNKFNSLKDHVIICGYNLTAAHIAKTIAGQEIDCIFIESDTEQAQNIKQAGYNVIIGDSANSKDLLRANIEAARALVCAFTNDADNIVAAMTAQNFKHHPTRRAPLKIVIRIDKEENLSKAAKVGADSVISPAVIGGELMAKEAMV